MKLRRGIANADRPSTADALFARRAGFVRLVATSLGAIVALCAADVVIAGADCRPGKMNASGTCDCPAGYKSTGGAGAARCEAAGGGVYVPTCGVPGKPACTPKAGGTKLPADAGSSVPYKGGTFTMGDSSLDLTDTGPPHSITIGEYQLDRYEVSAEEFKKCVDAGVCAAPPSYLPDTANSFRCNYGTTRTNHPMNCVTWQDASNYCTWKGKRLPTEGEWEYAARGTSGRKYPWGSTDPTCKESNFTHVEGKPTAGCGDGTAPIGTHDAGKTKEGIHDLAGNVEEWTWDWFGNYSGLSGSNPGGPLTGTKRVAKGSSWDLAGTSSSAAVKREGVEPTRRENWLGFRCAQGVSPSATPALYTKPVTAVASSGTSSSGCASGTAQQSFGSTMVGCGGTSSWASASSLCGGGWHLCNAAEFVGRHAGIAPTHHYWVSDYLNGSGSGSGNCLASTSAAKGNFCPTDAPMRVCSAISTNDGTNYCTWNRCGGDSDAYDLTYGGCNAAPAGYTNTAGAVCCSGAASVSSASTPPPSDLGTMVRIPGGKFTMGSVLLKNSQPEHTVTISGYSLDKYETTVTEYKKCVDAGSCPTPSYSISTLCNWNRIGHESHPVNCIDWPDAKKYCTYRGKRLPTDAEWEFAARGTDGRTYAWGSATGSCSRANAKWGTAFCTGAIGDTMVVGHHPLGTSPYGVHDMAGNISEWAFDYFATYASAAQFNPTGPATGTDHSVRGGNWEIGDFDNRTYSRVPYSGPKYWVGVRCAKTE